MSMLSEQRRKTKWVINPTKKPLWSTDSSGIKFGKQLMEKMGWSAGKGLGLKEQGIQEPLRVSFKNDTKGMGFKGNDDDWIEHQDEFNSLLSQLRGGDDSTDMKDSDVGKSEVKSLEEKSKSSKARVHYQKFTRGKDLSKYSENDLACILGTGKTKKEKQKTEKVGERALKTDGGLETSFGVTTINSGSINDYFKKKWTVGKAKSHNSADGNNDSSETSVLSISNNESFFSAQEESFKLKEINEEKYRKKHKLRAEKANAEESSKSDLGELENIEKSKKKRKKKNEGELHTDEPRHKKKKKDVESTSGHVIDFSHDSTSLRDDGILGQENLKDNTVVTKQKRKKNHTEIFNDKCSSEFVGEENFKDSSYQYIPVVEKMNGTVDIHLKEKSVKEKKKDKKEAMQKSVQNNGFKKCDNFELEIFQIHNNTDLTESCFETGTVKQKKKKKDKGEEFKPKSGNSFSALIQDSSEQNMETVNASVEGVEERKKKKDKKIKNNEVKNVDENYTVSVQEVPYNYNFQAEIINKVNGLIQGEVVPKPESAKKKNKKKDKKGKLNENLYNIQTEGICTEEINEPCEEDEVVEESIKKKKKKKKDKDKECETSQKGGSESNNKKKKKNKLKENVEGRDNKVNAAEEMSMTGDMEEQNKGVIAYKLDLSDSIHLNTDNVIAEFGTKTEAEKRIERLKPNLFEDAAAQKYFPEERRNERVLKLIKWANISEFKGANLRDVEGYGRQKLFKKQSR